MEDESSQLLLVPSSSKSNSKHNSKPTNDETYGTRTSTSASHLSWSGAWPDEEDPYGAQYLFKYIMFAQIFVYMEAGVVPSLLEQFTETFHLAPQSQGLLGAIVYIALSAASPLCAFLFRTHSARWVLGWSLVFNTLGLLLFAFTPVNYSFSTTFLILSRGIIGFTQAFLSVYAPLWIHEYCPKNCRASSMSYLQASIPVGVTLGYLVGSVAIWCSRKPAGCYWLLCWRWPLLLPVIFIAPLAIGTFFIPKKHIELRQVSRCKSFIVVQDNDDDSEEEKALRPHSSHNAKSSTYEEATELLKTPVFTCIVLGLSALFFVVTGIQYWVTLYLSTNTTDSAYVVHIAYLIVAGSGPIFGVFFGGWLIDQYGGYTGRHHQEKALKICVCLGAVGGLAGIPPSFLHSTYSIAIFLFIMLFCGGSILPGTSGIVISSVPRHLRPLASSIASTSYNLLGFAASNYIPGLIMTFFTNDSDCDEACLYRLGFRVVLAWSVWSFVFIYSAWRYSVLQANS